MSDDNQWTMGDQAIPDQPAAPNTPRAYGTEQAPTQPLPPLPLAHPVPPLTHPTPMMQNPLPSEPREYHHFLRTERARPWMGILAIITFVIIYLLVSTAIGVAAMLIDVARGVSTFEGMATGKVTLTPTLLLATNIATGLMIPASLLLQRAFFGQQGTWMHSVEGRFRWNVLGRAAMFLAPMFVVYVLVTTFVIDQPPTGAFTWTSALTLVIVVLTTPFQAAGEEYGARGLIARSAGSWVAKPGAALAVATLVSALLFGLAHGAQDPWLAAYYIYFGIGMSVIVWRTGGIEVAVLAHGLNNVFLFTIATVLGQEMVIDRSAGAGGAFMLVPMALITLIAAVVWIWAKRENLPHRSLPQINQPDGASYPPQAPPATPLT